MVERADAVRLGGESLSDVDSFLALDIIVVPPGLL